MEFILSNWIERIELEQIKIVAHISNGMQVFFYEKLDCTYLVGEKLKRFVFISYNGLIYL